MPKKIRVSRHGLTTCPSCLSHIQVASKLEETSCPFCGAGLAEEVGRSSLFGQGMQALLMAGKSGVLAASLVGLVSVVGCTEEEPEPGEDMAMEMEEADMEPINQDYGVEPMENFEFNVATPDYGIDPIEDMGSPQEDMAADMVAGDMAAGDMGDGDMAADDMGGD